MTNYQPYRGVSTMNREKAFQLYGSLYEILMNNHASGHHAGMLIGFTPWGQVDGWAKNINGTLVSEYIESQDTWPVIGEGANKVYLNGLTMFPGAALIDSLTGKAYNDGTLIEHVDKSLEAIVYPEDRNARHAAGFFGSYHSDGLWFIMSEEQGDLTVVRHGIEFTRAPDEKLTKKEFYARLDEADYKKRESLPIMQIGYEDLKTRSKVPHKLRKRAEEVAAIANELYGAGYTMLLGDPSAITSPLDGDILGEYDLEAINLFNDGDRDRDGNLINHGVYDLMQRVATEDGAIAFDFDGTPIGAKLYINRVHVGDKGLYTVRGEGVRKLAAAFASEHGVDAVAVGESGIVHSFRNGKKKYGPRNKWFEAKSRPPKIESLVELLSNGYGPIYVDN